MCVRKQELGKNPKKKIFVGIKNHQLLVQVAKCPGTIALNPNTMPRYCLAGIILLKPRKMVVVVPFSFPTSSYLRGEIKINRIWLGSNRTLAQ